MYKRDVRREKLRRVRKQLGKDLICLRNESGMSWTNFTIIIILQKQK